MQSTDYNVGVQGERRPISFRGWDETLPAVAAIVYIYHSQLPRSQASTFRLARSGIQVSCPYPVPRKVNLGLGNNVVGTDCVEFKPVDEPEGVR